MGSECSKKTIVKRQIFFNINRSQTFNRNYNFQNYKTPIKLEFTLDGCDKQKYQINLTMGDNKDAFSTEIVTVKQKILTFNTCYICDYYFERQQNFNIKLLKNGIDDGNIKVPLGIIVGSPNSTYKTKIGTKGEILFICAQSIKDTDSYIDFDFDVKSMKDINFGDINNKFSYKILNLGRLVYQSESISNFGKFQPVKIPIAILEPNFIISFLNSSQETIIFKDETIGSFTEPKSDDLFYLGFYVNNNKINIYNNYKIYRNYNFIDYIKNGVNIKLSIGIDFTSSNNQPNEPTSLHYLGGGMNDYELAIRACGTIVAYYDYNQLFPVYGFGALIKGQKKANMCFNINFKNNPEIYTIDNVINEYYNCFNKIYLAGPTEFCPLVKKVNETIIKENNPLKYHILMILTDGIIVDQQQTIDALVEGSFLPLSVIIIGIGNDHFKEMIELDGDDIPLINSNGIKRMRDLVQFVPFNKYKNDPNELAAQVLEEIPRQIKDYYAMNNIYPDNLNMLQSDKSGMNNKNIYESKNNTYNKFLIKSKNSYKNYMNLNTSKSFNRQSSLSSYKINLEDERLNKGILKGSIFY